MAGPTIFISYSHEDKKYLNALTQYLRVGEYSGAFELWSDQDIQIGEKWLSKIKEAIGRSELAILLISVNFMNSQFIRTNEIPLLQKRYEKGELEIIPVIAESCLWQRDEWLKQLQALPEDGEPIWGERDSQAAVAQVLTMVAESILNKFSGTQPHARSRTVGLRHKIRVVVADDQIFAVEGIASIIDEDKEERMEVVGKAKTEAETIAVVENTQPDVVLFLI